MEDKINLYLTNEIYQNLEEDIESFNYIDKNGKPRRNSFINTIIVNYFEQYEINENKNKEDMENVIYNHFPNHSKKDIDKLIKEFLEVANNRQESKDKDKKITFALKPTKQSSSTINSIMFKYSVNTSTSGYIRELIHSYTKLKRVDREIIIFKDIYDEVLKAINLNTTSIVKIKSSGKTYEVSPYKIMRDKSGLENYLLALGSDDRPYSFRLSNLEIASCTVTKQKPMSKDIIDSFNMSYERGLPVVGLITDYQYVDVKFTKDGMNLFSRLGINKPSYERIDDTTIRFHCTENQIYIYLKSFGDNAKVLSPDSVKNMLIEFYTKAIDNYQ